MFDLKCHFCEYTVIDRLEPVHTTIEERGPCPKCHTFALERVWLGKPANVIGDEIDIEIKNGLCNADGTPRRYTSKAEMAREAKRRNMVNYVEHVGTSGGDKSRHTSRWI